jgi:UDP-galactopyranose mutase
VLDTDYKKIINDVKFKKMIYTGPIDYFFDYEFGKLPYRSISFKNSNYKKAYMQESSVINHVGEEVEFTRVTEYKHLTKQKDETTTVSYEFPLLDGDPFYPVPSKQNREKYFLYREATQNLKTIIFCGRLAEYQYYNMDQVAAKSLLLYDKV